MSTPTLRCNDLRKTYPGQDEPALGDERAGVSFEVSKGELFALLGPSGCGKTTTLRIVGGFVAPDGGTVKIEERDVTHSQPYARRTNTVFQSYALFPHMDLRRQRRLRAQDGARRQGRARGRAPRASRWSASAACERRRRRALRRPAAARCAGARDRQAAGGAAARRAARRAGPRLRKQMQEELIQLKRSTGTTFVHVTHDQEEACAIADRIAVMDARPHRADRHAAGPLPPSAHRLCRQVPPRRHARPRAPRRVGDHVEVARGRLAVRGKAPAWMNGHRLPRCCRATSCR